LQPINFTLTLQFEKLFTANPGFSDPNPLKAFTGAAILESLGTGKIAALELRTPRGKHWTLPPSCPFIFPGYIE